MVYLYKHGFINLHSLTSSLICYTTTYNRYSRGINQLETIQLDLDIIKKVVAEHSEKLQKIS